MHMCFGSLEAKNNSSGANTSPFSLSVSLSLSLSLPPSLPLVQPFSVFCSLPCVLLISFTPYPRKYLAPRFQETPFPPQSSPGVCTESPN